MDALERLRRLNESAAEAAGVAVAAPAYFPRTPSSKTVDVRKASSGRQARTAPEPADSEADALERLARLNETLRQRSLQQDPEESSGSQQTPLARLRNVLPSGRIIKTVLAVAVAVALAWVPLTRLLMTTSAEATINAPLINVRAPIEGRVTITASSLAAGTLVSPGEPLLRIVNARADRDRLDDLRREVSRLRSESTALEKKIERLAAVEADLKAQSDAFQKGRVRQLEARAEELGAELKAAAATEEDALKSLNRSKDLQARGHQTVATLLHAERDLKVAKEKVAAARKRLDGNKIELEGARKGFFVGDSYNDLPRSTQRQDEVKQELVGLKAELEERKARLGFLDKELASETAVHASHASAEVVSPVRGRIWQILTADGELVLTGQELARILDCGGAVVTATVSESVYNELWIGQPVEFQLLGESQEYEGKVAALTGLTAAGSNFAIEQTALKRQPYHVTIAVPGLAAQDKCNIGRTGQVTFKDAVKAAAGHAGWADRAVPGMMLGHKSSASLARATTAAKLAATARGAAKALNGGSVSP